MGGRGRLARCGPATGVARAAQKLQHTAADAAARLEQQAPLLRQPRRTDYRTEIKRLQAVADQASQIAERWEPQRLPEPRSQIPLPRATRSKPGPALRYI